MITILSGTNRPGSNTLKVASIGMAFYRDSKVDAQLLDLAKLPAGIFSPEHYGKPPAEFQPFQKMILETDGILVVTPEYNGGFPGALKYFIDLLKFPDSLVGKPAAFIGVAAGRFGALRPIEQLEMIFQYREAHIYGKRVLLPAVESKLSADGTAIADESIRERFEQMLLGFGEFCRRLK
ncbi:MAG: NAD(P)H-dependent oxidoreductase [Deltaproteobacteria bacterium]|nr:NAD(P)H-dependent oxidoreductase [Deltaproteobacteria bacterium]